MLHTLFTSHPALPSPFPFVTYCNNLSSLFEMRLYFCRAVVPCIFNILLYPNGIIPWPTLQINNFVNNMDLNISNSFTHMLDTENSSDELNVIRCSPYITDDLLLQSMENRKYGLNILSLNCQSFHAKFDYIRLLIDKFMQKDCPLQAICL